MLTHPSVPLRSNLIITLSLTKQQARLHLSSLKRKGGHYTSTSDSLSWRSYAPQAIQHLDSLISNALKLFWATNDSGMTGPWSKLGHFQLDIPVVTERNASMLAQRSIANLDPHYRLST